MMKINLNVVKMGDGWNWLTVMSIMDFDINGEEPLSSSAISFSYYITLTGF
jgi:hypothetical protein